MSGSYCRWGILGAAEIARKNWQAIRRSGNGQLMAVASRDLQRARQFIADCQSHVAFPQAPRACATYEELLSSPDIDAVYIPLPTGVRKEWVIRAADAGKHVLVEKPVGVTASDVRAMLAACERNNVQFMDGVMFMHSQRLNRLRTVLDDGQSIGTLRRIATQFSFMAPEQFMAQNIRVREDLEPMGCLGDLGWYNVRFTLWVMQSQLPQRVTGRLLQAHQGSSGSVRVPLEFSGEMFFANNVSASFYCSFITENQQWASVSGTRGHLLVPDFVLPYFGSEVAFQVTNARFQVNGCDFNMENHTRREAVDEYSNSTANAQETNLFRNFGELVLMRRRDPYWGDIALKTQLVLDACLESAHRDSQPVSL